MMSMTHRDQERHKDHTDCCYHCPARWRSGLLCDPDDRTRKRQWGEQEGSNNALQ